MVCNDRLRKVRIFEGLSEPQLLKVEELATEERFAKNENIFRQGEPATSLYVVFKGRAKLLRHAPSGAATIIEIYSVGDELSAAAIIEGKSYHATARTLTDCTVLRMSAQNFRKLLSEWPNFASNVMKELGQRYRELVENLSSLAVYKVEGRLCKVMANLARRYGIYGDLRGVILDLALTRQDLADITGTTLETTIRTLNRLRNDGLISWEGKRFFIPDIKALEALASS
jgi:CRP/FNR family transcriptional regulator